MKFSRLSCFFLLILLIAGGIFIQYSPENTQVEAILPEKKITISATATTPSALSLHASYACAMDADSGRVLYEKKATTKAAMASTTKIITALLALESSKQNDTVTVSSYAASMPKVHLGMKAGEQYLLSDLLYSLMLESHNDTAVAIAEHLGGSVEGFADMMNQKAKSLGMTSTHFVTPNGLDSKGHQSTATDMCKLASYAVKNSDFLSLVQTKSYSISTIDGSRSFSLYNRDAFLSYYDGALGIKTGFTGDAGYCFVGAAKRNDVTLVSCVLASGWPPDKSFKWTDTGKLMDYGFEHYTSTTLPLQDLSTVKILVEDGKKSYVSCRIPATHKTLLSRFDNITVTYDLPEIMYAPIRKNQSFGSVSYYINGELFAKDNLFPSESIEKIDFSDTIETTLKLWFAIN